MLVVQSVIKAPVASRSQGGEVAGAPVSNRPPGL